ncbi:hypothetical protein [Pseudogemmobacter bohemicus]|uniref:hypothetical protein n=1 Tax=Pseudogemmobacter bohemicus TaxID=2250708 RepID=UPI00130067D2|nr:hypothetical protein [Pseudogemmobacter bohemicus]
MSAIDRRSFLRSAPTVGFAAMVAGAEVVEAAPENSALLAVIEDLEGAEGYDIAAMASGKLYAAYLIRVALGLDVPEETRKEAQHCIEFRNGAYERYLKSHYREIDLAAGKVVKAPPSSLPT